MRRPRTARSAAMAVTLTRVRPDTLRPAVDGANGNPGTLVAREGDLRTAAGRWDNAERLQQCPAYSYAGLDISRGIQVIGYSEARIAGAGSAIFVRVDQRHSTSGCVSPPTSALVSVMRGERLGMIIAITR